MGVQLKVDDMTTGNKKIILLSDGTGNSAGSRNRTNVWRLYDTLDVHRDDQIAFYDDGVGSQEFVLFKILGGAFGYGLKSNVRELYKTLCRSYEKGDKIYLFGFSRGAFTVRVLAGMIAYCGLETGESDDKNLDKIARKNYNAFRSQFHQTPFSWLYRKIRGLSEQSEANEHPDIQFIGVWDTVDAYGLPIDELSVLWDKIIFPIRFPDRNLSQKIKHACHAVSVDDERLTFHPLLWDEAGERKDRIEQVWFPGVHADIGGGYPQDNLSMVSLDWMISRIEHSGHDEEEQTNKLYFIPDKRQEINRHADWHGVQHDSRAGAGAYYRYKPRNIQHLCQDQENHVQIDLPKVHRSVFERIKRDVVPYAPTGLPTDYEMVSTRDEVTHRYETPQETQNRAEAMNSALDVIFWRRWLYGLLLATTALFLGSRFYLDWDVGGSCISTVCAIDPILLFAKDVLPDFLGGWFDAWRQNPTWLWSILGTFIVFLILKSYAWHWTQIHANAAWAVLKAKAAVEKPRPGRLRQFREKAHSEFRTASKWVMALAVLLIILFLLVALSGRAALHVRASLGWLCAETKAVELHGTQSVSLDISDPCKPTGLILEKGQKYRFTATGHDLKDGGMPSSPDGFLHYKLMPWTPLRRHVGEEWLKLMGRINADGNETFAIGTGPVDYTAKTEGELFLYVNDAVFGLAPGKNWALPYFWSAGTNQGTIEVKITQL